MPHNRHLRKHRKTEANSACYLMYIRYIYSPLIPVRVILAEQAATMHRVVG